MGEFTANAICVAVDDGASILIISIRATVLIGGSFGFRRIVIFNLFLMLKFCAVDFSTSSSTLSLRSLYSELLFAGCSCTVCMLAIS